MIITIIIVIWNWGKIMLPLFTHDDTQSQNTSLYGSFCFIWITHYALLWEWIMLSYSEIVNQSDCLKHQDQSCYIIIIVVIIIPWLKKIIWVIGVLRRTVVIDWCFDNLCGSHLQSQVVVLVSWKGLQSPRWSFSIKVCYSWVQTIFLLLLLLLLLLKLKLKL